jgi:L-seryl-tRNA(Ser) seleniumtransferase
MFLKVHPSNYRIVGFTTSPELADLVELAHRKKVLIYEDAGSGALSDLDPLGLGDEPVISRSISAGVDLVSFSGDKLLGGPQAGIIVGKKDSITTLRTDPLYRALRVGKLVYGALEATLEAHLRGTVIDEIPVLRMLAADVSALEHRCRQLIGKIDNRKLNAELTHGNSAVGGGAAPTTAPESPLISLSHSGLSADGIEQRLRESATPVVARIANDRVLIDLRTVAENEVPELLDALNAI